MKPIEKYIFNLCRVPQNEHEEILDAVGYTDNWTSPALVDVY